MDEAAALVLAGTPIGDRDDASPALRAVLETADVIAAEDTRKFRDLCRRLEIAPRARVVSFFDGNEADRVAGLLEHLRAGRRVVVVSDAGMPAVSDPGYRLVAAAAEAGITVTATPGPSAVLTALAVSGLPTDRFCFEGFLPQKKGRQTFLEGLRHETRTMVFYESPYRTLKTLTQFREVFGPDRNVSVAREISKVHEEHVRGTLDEVIAHFQQTEPRGEIVIVLAGEEKKKEEKKNKKAEEPQG